MILHMISEMQSKLPTKQILIRKTDLDAAYCQIHANVTTASKFIAIVHELAFLCLWLNFGTTPTPTEYTTVSGGEIDLGNDLLQEKYWDTDYLKSPHRSLIPQEYKQQSTTHARDRHKNEWISEET